MRSARPSSCSSHRPGPAHGFLPRVAGIIDQTTLDEPGHVLVHVDGPVHPDVCLGFKSIGRHVHPFEVLAGFTAPDSWTAFGIRARGNAHHLDHPDAPPERTAVTFLVDRDGNEASVLRMGETISEPAAPAVGTIPDVARRVLGVATSGAPTSTAPLWTAMWLDRVLERWCQPERRRDLTSSWGQIAVLHPAVHAPAPPDVVAFADPASLVSVARSHAAATSWDELRRSPLPLALPGARLERDVARWMDDGFFARWTIGAFPSIATMATDLRELLGGAVGRQLLETTAALLR
jgi:hypothetical protein